MQVVRDIVPGEELVWDYGATYWGASRPTGNTRNAETRKWEENRILLEKQKQQSKPFVVVRADDLKNNLPPVSIKHDEIVPSGRRDVTAGDAERAEQKKSKNGGQEGPKGRRREIGSQKRGWPTFIFANAQRLARRHLSQQKPRQSRKTR